MILKRKTELIVGFISSLNKVFMNMMYIVVEILPDDFCNMPCCPKEDDGCIFKPCETCGWTQEKYTCGGEMGKISVFYDFVAPVTVGLNVYLKNQAGENVVIHYPSSPHNHPPLTTMPPTTTTTTTTTTKTTTTKTTTTRKTTTTEAAADDEVTTVEQITTNTEWFGSGTGSGSGSGSGRNEGGNAAANPEQTTTEKPTTTTTPEPTTAAPVEYQPNTAYNSKTGQAIPITSYKKLNIFEVSWLLLYLKKHMIFKC